MTFGDEKITTAADLLGDEQNDGHEMFKEKELGV
jgi:hypothetical protein